MKSYAIFLTFLITSCSVNITPQSFIYQDQDVEKQLDLAEIQSKIRHDQNLISISKIALKTQEGLTLNGVKLTHENATINIVFYGGNGMKISAASSILDQFALVPANVIWFDYRGTGVSEKKSDLYIADMKSDALAVFDFARENLPRNIPTVVHGLSMGSLLASYVSNERKIDGLILDGAINSVPQLVDNLVPTWSRIFSTVNVAPELAEIDNMQLIQNYTNPLLFLIGETDTTTPVSFSQELYDQSLSAVKTIEIIPDTEHGQTMTKDQAIKSYQLFITKLVCCKNG